MTSSHLAVDPGPSERGADLKWAAERRDFDVAIVGGGLVGLATGFELLQRGRRVLILEASSEVAMGASFANGGLLTPSMSDPWNQPGVFAQLLQSVFDPKSALKLRLRAVPGLWLWGLTFLRNSSEERYLASTQANFRLAQYSTKLTREVSRGFSFRFDASDRGSLKLFRSQKAMEAPLRLARTLAESGLAYETLDGDGVVKAEPQLAPIRQAIFGGLRFPSDGSGDARAFSIQMAATLSDLGGVIATGVTVKGTRLEGGRVVGLRTSVGDVVAKVIILTAGALSPSLAAQVGVRLSVAPVKGYSVTFEASRILDRPDIPVVDDEMHAAITPLGTRLRVVGTAEFSGFDSRLNGARITNLIRLFDSIYPHIAPRLDAALSTSWAGLRPMSADGRPFIGSTSVPGFWVNTGHGHLGWTMAMGSARLIADQIEARTPDIDPGPYQLDRELAHVSRAVERA